MKIRFFFTLLEVIIAIMILTSGIVGAMSMATLANTRILKAYNAWEAQNRFSQAIEYYLLCGTDTNIPQNIYPYNDYLVVCREAPCQNLPQGVSFVNGPMKLMTYEFTLKDKSSGKLIKTLKIDKIEYENKRSSLY